MTAGPSLTRWYRRFLRGLACATLIGIAAGCLQLLESRARAASSEDKMYFPSGRFLREAVVGYREMAADLLWFQTVQYYGAYRKGEHDLRYFNGLVDCVITLDPRFVEAYYFGSLVASLDQGEIPHSVDLLKRGILVNPDTWVLPFHIGFTYYVLLQDYERAATWFQLAACAPDATDFARRFAAYAHGRSGNLAGSRTLWQNLHETTSNPAMKALAQRMIAECEAALAQAPRQ